MATKTIEELKNEILVVPYVDLEPHIKRASVIYLHPDLDLLQVALSIAKDDKAVISALVLKKLLIKSTMDDYENWKREKRFFKCIILQPFIVIQNDVALKKDIN